VCTLNYKVATLANILQFLKALLSHRTLWLAEYKAAGVGQHHKFAGRYPSSVFLTNQEIYTTSDGTYCEVSRVGLPNFIEIH